MQVKFCLVYSKGDTYISEQIWAIITRLLCEAADELCSRTKNFELQSESEVGIWGLPSTSAWN